LTSSNKVVLSRASSVTERDNVVSHPDTVESTAVGAFRELAVAGEEDTTGEDTVLMALGVAAQVGLRVSRTTGRV
jgi:hypothetical protein